MKPGENILPLITTHWLHEDINSVAKGCEMLKSSGIKLWAWKLLCDRSLRKVDIRNRLTWANSQHLYNQHLPFKAVELCKMLIKSMCCELFSFKAGYSVYLLCLLILLALLNGSNGEDKIKQNKSKHDVDSRIARKTYIAKTKVI